MARTCDICNKRTEVGSQVCRRGIAKKKGGIGIRITSREKRTFKPNIQNIRARTHDGKPYRARVCTRCLKAGKIAKR
jgi:large subunit ribosomal protein L28